MLVEHYRELGTPTANQTFDEELKKINAWADANVGSSERENRHSDGLQREFTREEVKTYVAKLETRKTAETD